MIEPASASAGSIDWVRTLIAKGPRPLHRGHLRYQPIQAVVPALHLIVLDTSGSMRQRGRLALAKGYAARLIEQAARTGDDVGVLSFGGDGIEVLVPPGPARAAGAMRVRQRGGGGGTPLAQAMVLASCLLERHASHKLRDSTLWLLTDGRTLEQPQPPSGVGQIVIIDFDHPDRPVGRCAAWAQRWPAEYRRA